MQLSIIIPLFNSEEFTKRIETTLLPFINCKDTEVIFIDDASTDCTVRCIEKLIKVYAAANINFIINPVNKGPSYSRNKGLKLARGEYIAFLDSDDAWHYNKIKLQLDIMQKQNILICGTCHKVVHEKKLISERYRTYKKKYNYKYIKWPNVLFKSPFATPSVVIHKSLKNYYFDEALKYSEDYNLWIRIIHKHPALKLKNPLTFTFKHDYLTDQPSLSSNIWLMQMGNVDSFCTLFREKEFNSFDKLYIVLGLLFSWVKFLKRCFMKLNSWITQLLKEIKWKLNSWITQLLKEIK